MASTLACDNISVGVMMMVMVDFRHGVKVVKYNSGCNGDLIVRAPSFGDTTTSSVASKRKRYLNLF